MSKTDQQHHSYQLFTQSWGVYQKIIEKNYMFHHDFKKEVPYIFKYLTSKKPIKLLDLGCGDASFISQILANYPVESYTGIDSAEMVLQIAEENLTKLNIPHVLKLGNMEELITKETESFDLIFSSYAIHHLAEENKAALLANCFSKINKQGCLLLIDIFRTHAEDRPHYIERYTELINKKWNQLNENEKELLIDHLTQFDFPSNFDQFKKMATDIGFSVKPSKFIDKTHKLILLIKP